MKRKRYLLLHKKGQEIRNKLKKKRKKSLTSFYLSLVSAENQGFAVIKIVKAQELVLTKN